MRCDGVVAHFTYAGRGVSGSVGGGGFIVECNGVVERAGNGGDVSGSLPPFGGGFRVGYGVVEHSTYAGRGISGWLPEVGGGFMRYSGAEYFTYAGRCISAFNDENGLVLVTDTGDSIVSRSSGRMDLIFPMGLPTLRPYCGRCFLRRGEAAALIGYWPSDVEE